MRVAVRREGTATRLDVSGEVDLANAPALDAQLRAAEALPADALLIDLSKVEFLDVNAARVLLQATERATAEREVQVVATSPAVRRLFDVLGPAHTARLRTA